MLNYQTIENSVSVLVHWKSITEIYIASPLWYHMTSLTTRQRRFKSWFGAVIDQAITGNNGDYAPRRYGMG